MVPNSPALIRLKDTLRIFAEMVGGQVDAATGQRSGGIAVKPEAMERAALRGSLNARNTLGGTAPTQVRLQVARHRQRLG